MRLRALQRLGHDVHGVNTTTPWRQATWLARQVQRRTEVGSILDQVNVGIIEAAHAFKPDLIWAEKQEYLRSATLQELKERGIRTVHFTPDPYFSLSWKRTRTMDAAFRHFDVLIYCKNYERQEYSRLGARLIYMPLGYCDEVHRPMASDDARWKCNFGFLGGWEPRRETYLRELVAAGLNLKIWGGYWEFLRDGRWSVRRHIILKQLAGGQSFRFHRDELLSPCLQGQEIYEQDYAKALTGSKIGVGFLRKICPDEHTTRTFEIPACGSMLLADRSEEHESLFVEGREAEFFSSLEEFIEKAKFYSSRDETRQRIANAGRQRCINSQYSYFHRLKKVIKSLET